MPIRQAMKLVSIKKSSLSPLYSKTKTRPGHVVPEKAAVTNLPIANLATKSVWIAGEVIRFGPIEERRNLELAQSIRKVELLRLGSTTSPNTPGDSRPSR